MTHLPKRTEVALDFKGPMGGKDGFYYHVNLDTYSRYPEIAIVMETKFSTLKPVMEETFSRWESPNNILHDCGPPYNSYWCQDGPLHS